MVKINMKKINTIIGIAVVALVFALVLAIAIPQVGAAESTKYAYVNLDTSISPIIKQGYTTDKQVYGVLSLSDKYKVNVVLTTNIANYTEFNLSLAISELRPKNLTDRAPELSSYQANNVAVPLVYTGTQKVIVDKDRNTNYTGTLYEHTYVAEIDQAVYKELRVKFGDDFESNIFVSLVSGTMGPEFSVEGASPKYTIDGSLATTTNIKFTSQTSSSMLSDMNLKAISNANLNPFSSYNQTHPVVVSQDIAPAQVTSVRRVDGKNARVEAINIKNVLVSADSSSNQLGQTKDVFILGDNGTNKIKEFSSVLSEQNINPESIVDSVELINVNDAPKYVFSVKEKRMLFGFIPFGTRTVTKSIDATESLANQ